MLKTKKVDEGYSHPLFSYLIFKLFSFPSEGKENFEIINKR